MLNTQRTRLIGKLEEVGDGALFYQASKAFMGLPFYLKLEWLNIAGSIKLKTAIYLIDFLKKENRLIKGKSKIIESSSGNLGVALSIVCKSHNLPFTCVIDPNTSPTNAKLMKLYGAEVIQVTEKDENGGYLGTRIKTIRAMLEEDPYLIWTNQYENLSNPRAHYETTAQEIADAFPQVDYLFVGAGTCGTLMGCTQLFQERSPGTKVIAVDAEGSVTFGKPAKKRNIPGLGTSKRPPILDESLVDEVLIISEKETVQACHDFLALTGLILGGSSGTVLAALRNYAHHFTEEDVIVAISPDFGERYLNTIYEPSWVNERILNI